MYITTIKTKYNILNVKCLRPLQDTASCLAKIYSMLFDLLGAAMSPAKNLFPRFPVGKHGHTAINHTMSCKLPVLSGVWGIIQRKVAKDANSSFCPDPYLLLPPSWNVVTVARAPTAI